MDQLTICCYKIFKVKFVGDFNKYLLKLDTNDPKIEGLCQFLKPKIPHYKTKDILPLNISIHHIQESST